MISVKKKLFYNNKIIYFFYKIAKILRNKKKGWHFAEFAEDVLVDRYLHKFKKGIYIDIGCYHPYKGSLTFKLFKRGWSGVNIDLSKFSVDLFKISRPKDINICCAISSKNKQIKFFENSKINQQNSILFKGKKLNQIKKIQSYQLNKILEKHKILKFDYLNIDVEGAEFQVLQGFNLKKFRPKLITLEINNFKDGLNASKCLINKYLYKNNYILFNRVGVTNFYFLKKYIKKVHELIDINNNIL